MTLSKWDTRFMKLAKEVSSWSKEYTKVGCVLANGNVVLGLGYNGPPEGPEPPLNDRDARRKVAVHAEANALYMLDWEWDRVKTLYSTKHPCEACATLVLDLRCNATKSMTRYISPPPLGAWKETQEKGKELLERHGIKWINWWRWRSEDWIDGLGIRSDYRALSRTIPASTEPAERDQEAGAGERKTEKAGRPGCKSSYGCGCGYR